MQDLDDDKDGLEEEAREDEAVVVAAEKFDEEAIDAAGEGARPRHIAVVAAAAAAVGE